MTAIPPILRDTFALMWDFLWTPLPMFLMAVGLLSAVASWLTSRVTRGW